MTNTPLLSLDEVRIRHDGASRATPDGVTLEVRPGEVVLVLGPSGCGKSTLALALDGLIPHAVPAELDGTVLASAPDRLVASPGGLVAMKATTIPLRTSSKPEKRASDLYDLGRLLGSTGGWAEELAGAPGVLADAVRERVRGWFVDPGGRDRTFRDTRRFDEVRLDLDDVADAVQEAWP